MMKARYNVVDGEIVSERRDGIDVFRVPDGVGSTIAICDADGNITDRLSYWPFGEVATRTGANDTPFLFRGSFGYYSDTLTCANRRFIATKLGRWITVNTLIYDELVAFQTTNDYLFSNNNPNINDAPSEGSAQFSSECFDKVAVGRRRLQSSGREHSLEQTAQLVPIATPTWHVEPKPVTSKPIGLPGDGDHPPACLRECLVTQCSPIWLEGMKVAAGHLFLCWAEGKMLDEDCLRHVRSWLRYVAVDYNRCTARCEIACNIKNHTA